jgi:hypothetical protein
MSSPPPDRNTSSTGAAGPEVSITEARGAERTGRNIWILVISTLLAVVLLIGYWLLHAPHMANISHPQVRDMNTQDVSTFNTPAGSARGAPPDARTTNAQ